MILDSTNKLNIEANADIPAIIYRKRFTATTTTSGSGYVEIVSTVTADGIKIGGYNNFDLFVKTPTSIVVAAPFKSFTSSVTDDLLVDIYIDSSTMTNSSSTATYTYQIRKYGGAVTDSYTCWLVVWSTKINKDLDIFTTAT